MTEALPDSPHVDAEADRETELRAALAAGPEAGALCSLAQLLADRGSMAESESIWREAVRLDRWCPEAFHGLAACLSASGRFDEAVEAEHVALGLRPRSAKYAKALGELYLRRGLTDEARDAFTYAVACDASFANSIQQVSASAPVEAPPHLFVIGHGRSGTTVLLNALNSCRDIYLLGEAQFYQTGDRPFFRAWYNAQHRGWGNQPTKSAYAPAIAAVPESATGHDYLGALAGRVRWVGEKIILGPRSSRHDPEKLKGTIERRWWHSRYIWAVRRPRSIIASCQRLWGGDVSDWMTSVADSLLLLIHMCRILPHVVVVDHQSIDRQALDVIGRFIGVELPEAFNLYTNEREAVAEFGEGGPHDAALAALDQLHMDLVALIDPATLSIPQSVLQIEQQLSGHDFRYPRRIGIIHRGLAEFVNRQSMTATER